MGLSDFFNTKDPLKTLTEELKSLEDFKSTHLSEFESTFRLNIRQAKSELDKLLKTGNCDKRKVANMISAIYHRHKFLKKEITQIEELKNKIDETEKELLSKLKLLYLNEGEKKSREIIFKINEGFTVRFNSLGRPVFDKDFSGIIFVKEGSLTFETHDDHAVLSEDVGTVSSLNSLKPVIRIRLNQKYCFYFKNGDSYTRRKTIAIKRLDSDFELDPKTSKKEPAESSGRSLN